jgi:hypothetical protein
MGDSSFQIPRDVLTHLKQRYEGLANDYAQFDAEAEEKATRWEWASGVYHDLRPLYHKRYEIRRGQLLEGEPTKAGDVWCFGLTNDGRLVAKLTFRHHYQDPSEAEYYHYDASGVDIVRYMNTHFPITESYIMGGVARLSGGLLQPEWYAELHGMFSMANILFEQYFYDGERLKQVKIRSQSGVEPDNPAHDQVHQITYEADDLPTVRYEDKLFPEQFRYLRNLNPHTVHSALSQDAQALFEMAVASLKQRIVDVVTQEHTQLHAVQPLYCLEISYDSAVDDGFLISFGVESQRKRFMEKTYERWFGSLHLDVLVPTNTSKYANLSALKFPLVAAAWIEKCRDAHQWDDIRAMFSQVARELNTHNWTEIFEPTELFIVFAYDHESHDDVEPYVLECIPPEKRALWEADGWFV